MPDGPKRQAMSCRLLGGLLGALLWQCVPFSALAEGAEFEHATEAMQAGDYAVAYCLWLPMARDGDAAAQYNLGWLYANGNGLNVNVEEAVRWWRLAAEQGHTDAEFAIGLAYTTGEGIDQDLERAVDWFRRAAGGGHGDARDIIRHLIADPSRHILERFPELVHEPWLGEPMRVTGERVNVRSGPGTGHAVILQKQQGELVRALAQEGEWVLAVISSQGRTGWIHNGLLTGAGP